MLSKAAKVNTKVKTKGRFAVEIPTNGTLNRVDTAWAKRANPVAFKAQEARDLVDLKMLEKKKKGRELAAKLWLAKKQTFAEAPDRDGQMSPASSNEILSSKKNLRSGSLN